MARPGLRLAGLGLLRGGHAAQQDVAAEVPDGEVLTLLGAPGSGKTRLLEILAGQKRTRSGSIMLDEKPASSALLRRHSSFLAANFPLPEDATLIDAVAAPLRQHGVPRARRLSLAESALDLAELEQAGRRVRQVAPAERQRVAWARAAVVGPRLLLLDEPLGAQPSEQLAAALWALHRLIRATGAATILATRSFQAGLALADRGLALEAGRMLQAGTPAELYERASSRSVAMLTGAVNLLPGHVLEIEEGMAQVRLRCGPVVGGELRGELRVRDPCWLCVRPERVAVAAMAAAELGAGALDAVVADRLMLGDRVHLRLLIGSGAPLEAVRPVAAGTRGLEIGAAVAVAWQEAHAGVIA